MRHFGLARAGLGALSYDFHIFLCPVTLRAPRSKLKEVKCFSRAGKYFPLIVIAFLATIIFCDPLIFTAF